MKKLSRVYISLGSNLGDRFGYLQQAVNAIAREIGVISKISKVYETPAWGFEGETFLNACLAAETSLLPIEVLQQLLQIENSLGRVRQQSEGYHARTLDLDVLFYDDEVISLPNLQVPHPQIANRKFVLVPLATIAPGKIHPKLDTSVTELLQHCADDSELYPWDAVLQNPSQQAIFSKYNYIAIEGNIGAGKTTLAHKIANDYNAKLVLERFADNPFLPKFYEDNSRYAFPLEMSFLADRYQQINDDLSQFELFKDFIVSDYDVFKSLIFAKVTLQEEEFALYRKVFTIMYKEMVKPDLYIYLHQDTDRLLANIKKRGRDYEQKIPAEYLKKINAGYIEFMKTQKELNVLVLDITDKDFVANDNDYQFILDAIANHKR